MSNLEERSKQAQFTQVTAMKKIHTTAVAFQEATAIIAVEETTTNPEVTATHVVEAMTATIEVEETTPAITTETIADTQVATQRHQPGTADEVTPEGTAI